MADIHNVRGSELSIYFKRHGQTERLDGRWYEFDAVRDMLIDHGTNHPPTPSHHVADPVAHVEHGVVASPTTTTQAKAFDSPVSITVVSHRTRLTDVDGVCAKWAIDALVKAGIISDDSPQYVEEVAYRQVRVATKPEEKTELIIETTTNQEPTNHGVRQSK